MFRTMHVARAQVQPGDRLVNAVGKPYFKVNSVEQARQRGYLIFIGQKLLPFDGVNTGGHQSGIVTVQRFVTEVLDVACVQCEKVGLACECEPVVN